MKRFLRPTLLRRILITALLAFVLSFAVITAYTLFQKSKDQSSSADYSRKLFVESLSEQFSELKTDQEVHFAAKFLQGRIETQNRLAHQPTLLYIQVWTNAGKQIFTSLKLPVQRPTGLTSTGEDFAWHSQNYIVRSFASTRYTVDVLFLLPFPSVFNQYNFGFLNDLLIKMLIAFPLVLLPVWFAIHTGLRPLGALSDVLRKRPADDLTPVFSNMRYEELQPVVRAINDLLERLRKKIHKEQSFVHDAAHELQTPLAVIANQTHILAAATTSNERTEAHRNAEHAIERAAHLVRQMVVLSRLDTDLLDECKTFDVAAKVRELLAPLVPGAIDKSLDLSLESPDRVMLYGDPGALHSIVGNLVDNALRYIGDGGHIQVEIESQDDVIILRVLDDGPGIRAEDRERVFDRYYRVVGTGVSGSGLGLAIVKQAVARIKGTITLDDGLNGKGCAFVVTIPAVRP